MTSKVLDKENSTTFGALSNSKGLGLGNAKSFGFANANQLLKSEKTHSTPVISLEKKALINNAKELVNTAGRRRALGDVLNTAPNRQNSMGVGVTPKVDRTFHIENTPSSKLANSFSKMKLNELQQQACVGKKEAQEEVEVPPAERFIGSKYDNFDDLFNDGRLSELFLMPEKAVFGTNLNHHGYNYNGLQVEEKIQIDDEEDGLFELELRKVKKSLKKMSKKVELKSQKMECLDDLMPKICEDSSDEE
jgi:hypothetical protein